MKIKSLFFASAVLLAALTGCNKEDGNQGGDGLDPSGVSDVFLQFTEATKAEALEVPDNTAVTFGDGMIFFVNDNDDEIVRAYTIGSGKDYSITQLKSGTTFTGIPNSANVVYVIGNQSFSGSTAEGASMKALLNEATDLSEQTDSNSGVDNATLVGEGNLVVSTQAGIDREAIVTVEPIIGRIELAKLTLTDGDLDPIDPTDTVVVSYKLAGIYINNFYYDAAVHGGLVSAGQQPYLFGRVPANYDKAPAGKYQTSWENLVFDQYSAFSAANNPSLGLGPVAPDTKSIVPATVNNVWAYNLFSTPQNLPRIILHLEDVMIDCYDDDTDVTQGNTQMPYPNAGTAPDGTAYLTVQYYTDLDNNVNIETIETGKIYKINDLKFNYFDLTDNPEENVDYPDDEFKVWVEVILLNWKAVNVEGGF